MRPPKTESTAEAVAVPVRSRLSLRRIEARHVRDYGIIAVTAVVFIALSLASSAFFSVGNLFNILYQNAPLAIMACATTLVVVAGNFDLSVGAMYAVAAISAAEMAVRLGPLAGILFGIVVGGFTGLINGLVVTRLRVNAFLATLATSLAFRGFAIAVTNGFLVEVRDPGFTGLGRDKIGPVPVSVIIAVVVILILQFVLSRTVFGRYIYAVGGNPGAASISGVRVSTIVLATFVIGGFAAGLAGVIDASSVASGDAQGGQAFALTAVAAVALGGTSIYGGIGSVWRTCIGVALFALITNGFNLLGVNPYYQDIAKGLLIIFAVALGAMVERREGR
ncbi:MAG: ABC transporter permease [Actinobacteria bacterium]|nr:ABC transporter permease [Actinomycetota bacterium]